MLLQRFVCASLAAVALWAGLATEASAAGPFPVPYRARAGLFQNYYVQPSVNGGVGAKLYPSPHPVPAWVGGSYYTYEGLYPQEHMYPHMKTYRRGNGLIPSNTTRILYW